MSISDGHRYRFRGVTYRASTGWLEAGQTAYLQPLDGPATRYPLFVMDDDTIRNDADDIKGAASSLVAAQEDRPMPIDTDPVVIAYKLTALARSCRAAGLDARKQGTAVVIRATAAYRYYVSDNRTGQWLWTLFIGDDMIGSAYLHTPVMGATTDAAAELVDVLAGRQD